KAASYLLNPKSEVWPGLLGTQIDLNDGHFTNSDAGWSGGADSFYEYLLKMYIYDSSRYGKYRDRWILAADSSMKHLVGHSFSKPGLTFLGASHGQTVGQEAGHLDCFAGGNFILGGQVLGRQDYIDFGLKLVDGCHAIYNSTTTGIGPDHFSWNPTNVPTAQKDFFQRNGFWIISGNYKLRPEVIESYYYAYRATGNEMYRDWAWDAFMAVNNTCRVKYGFSSISDVNASNGGEKKNFQESFLFGEVLKYSYMIQRPVSRDPG
ncbi:MAG: hypothetical protein Q9183_007952, partial [Haloplaca sp. 2 TL-2023]